MKKSKTLKRPVSLLIAFLMIFSILPDRTLARPMEDETISAPTYLAIEVESGQILVGKNYDKKLAVASMSKLMTYYLVKKAIQEGRYKLTDKVKITPASEKLTTDGYSNMALKAGEVLTVDELLKGLMVVSGNDAAVALAINDAKNEENFAGKMNQMAEKLGLEKSNFVNASGIPLANDDQNMMSPRDLLTLARAIVKDFPEVKEYATIKILSMPKRNFSKESTFHSLGNIPGMMGLKTGLTRRAGYCFAGYFDLSKFDSTKDFEILTVVMGAKSEAQRVEESEKLVKKVTDNFSRKLIVKTDLVLEKVKNTRLSPREIKFYPKNDFYAIVANSAKVKKEVKLDYPKNQNLKQGEDYGDIILTLGNEEIGRLDITVKNNYDSAGFMDRLKGFFGNIFHYLGLMIFN